MGEFSASVPPSHKVAPAKVVSGAELQNGSPLQQSAYLGPVAPLYRDASRTDTVYVEGLPTGKPVDISIYSNEPALWPNRLLAFGKTVAADSIEELVVRVLQSAHGHPIRKLELIISNAMGGNAPVMRVGEDLLFGGDRPYEQAHLETLKRLTPMFAPDGKVVISGTIEESLRQELENALGVPVETKSSPSNRKQPLPAPFESAKK